MPNDVFILKGKHIRDLLYFHASLMVQVTSPTIGCLRKDGWPRSVTMVEQVPLPSVFETVSLARPPSAWNVFERAC